MGRKTINRHSNSFLMRKDEEASFMNRIHRARVTDVYVDKGTVNVLFDTLPYSRQITMPLLGLSVPPKISEDDKNYLRSSWGRYIPQVGDSLTIAFGADGTPYVIGYHAIFYGALDQYDIENEARGGIGWGISSGRPALKPGDWDFMSSRNCTLYLGDRAKLSAGPHSIVLNKPSGDITTTTTLNIGRYGERSESRQGGARRRVLPTDQDETDIYSSRGGIAQEFNSVVKYGGLTPDGTEIARTSIGDVIDEVTFLPMLGEASSLVRKLESFKDNTGAVEVYNEKIDTGGNAVVEANTATKFSWSTPVAAWNIENLSTDISSTSSINITADISIDIGSPTISINADTSISMDAPTINVTADTSISMDAPTTNVTADILIKLESALIQLGQAAADPVMKGTIFNSSLMPVLVAMAADFTAISSIIGVGSASSTAINTFLGLMTNYLSTKVMVE